MKNSMFMLLSMASFLMLSGCGDNDKCDVDHTDTTNKTETKTTIDTTLQDLIKTHNLSGNPAKGVDIPSLQSPKAQLGMKLFYTKALGGDKDSACVTCHHPALGGGDRMSLPIGVAAIDPDLLGEGRAYDPNAIHYDNGYALVGRNAPSTYNVALWKNSVFWDGRVAHVLDENNQSGIRTPDTPLGVIDENASSSLATAQARFPVTSGDEMRGFVFEEGNSTQAVREHLVKRLTDTNASDYIPNTWEAEFAPVYGDNNITFNNIVDAIGTYESTQVFINNPWKSYIEGDKDAISESAKRGAKLFYSSYSDGGFNCVSCHSGDMFSDEDFHVMAMVQVGHGKNANHEDFGRFHNTLTDKYAFRTPSLLNVEMTGPWGHDGAYTELKDVVAHMVNPEKAIANYDPTKLDSSVLTTDWENNTKDALNQLQANRNFGISKHQSKEIKESELDDLVAFLKTLTDGCLKDRTCIGKWIPEESQGVDSLQLNAKDKDGNLL